MFSFRPLYNASPGSDLPVVRRDDESSGGGVVLQCMKWGLIPSFTEKSEKPNYFKMVLFPLFSFWPLSGFRAEMTVTIFVEAFVG